MGLLAGFFRGWVDTVVSRLTEMVMVFPALLFIIAVRVTAGDTLNAITFGGLLVPGVFTLTLIFAVFGWFYPGRIVRGVVLSLREKEFVEAARMTGAGDWRIMRSHLLPHLVGPVIVYSTLIVAQTIIAEAGLSFLGLGIELPNASWGNLLQGAKDWYIQQPWLMVWPGLAILLTTLAFNLLGDGLRDAFDPRATNLTPQLTAGDKKRLSPRTVQHDAPPGGDGGTSERKESDAKQDAAFCSVCEPRGDDAGRGDLRRDGQSSASKPAAKPVSKHALKGGTLRVNASNNDFEFSIRASPTTRCRGRCSTRRRCCS